MYWLWNKRTKASRAKVAELLNINASNEVVDLELLDISDRDDINTDKVNSDVENKSQTKWEAFKGFILDSINEIRNLFRSPYSIWQLDHADLKHYHLYAFL